MNYKNVPYNYLLLNDQMEDSGNNYKVRDIKLPKLDISLNKSLNRFNYDEDISNYKKLFFNKSKINFVKEINLEIFETNPVALTRLSKINYNFKLYDCYKLPTLNLLKCFITLNRYYKHKFIDIYNYYKVEILKHLKESKFKFVFTNKYENRLFWRLFRVGNKKGNKKIKYFNTEHLSNNYNNLSSIKSICRKNVVQGEKQENIFVDYIFEEEKIFSNNFQFFFK